MIPAFNEQFYFFEVSYKLPLTTTNKYYYKNNSNQNRLYKEDIKVRLESCHKEVFRWALKCCNNNIDHAKDIMQNVYLKILDGKANYNELAAFKTWLFSLI